MIMMSVSCCCWWRTEEVRRRRQRIRTRFSPLRKSAVAELALFLLLVRPVPNIHNQNDR